MPIDLKVVPLREPALQENPAAFLRALADDIESGATPNLSKAVLVSQGENGNWILWTFGPALHGSVEALGLISMAQFMMTDKIWYD